MEWLPAQLEESRRDIAATCAELGEAAFIGSLGGGLLLGAQAIAYALAAQLRRRRIASSVDKLEASSRTKIGVWGRLYVWHPNLRPKPET